MFGLFKKAAGDAVNKLSGKTDLLEAGFAIAARVAAKEGGIDDEEIVGAIEAAQGIDTLTAAFTPSQIEACAMKQFNRAKTPMGRVQLKKELEDVAKCSQDDKELIFMVGVMAADASGGISAVEKEQLLADAKIIGLGNAQELLAA